MGSFLQQVILILKSILLFVKVICMQSGEVDSVASWHHFPSDIFQFRFGMEFTQSFLKPKVDCNQLLR